jgi:hypothetical protein
MCCSQGGSNSCELGRTTRRSYPFQSVSEVCRKRGVVIACADESPPVAQQFSGFFQPFGSAFGSGETELDLPASALPVFLSAAAPRNLLMWLAALSPVRKSSQAVKHRGVSN